MKKIMYMGNHKRLPHAHMYNGVACETTWEKPELEKDFNENENVCKTIFLVQLRI